MGFIDDLKWRGMIHDIIPGTEDLLNKERVKGYIGFDPTADSLGVGNLVQVMMLLHFQRSGHQPYVLIGGATGMVGDPSGKSVERNMLSIDELQHNLKCQKEQLEHFLDFNCSENPAVMVNNYDWFKDFTFLNFIREVGKHITVNYMLAKESVKKRLETGMSFTEFSYQLVQGYDFYYLYKHHGVKLQMGGSDQWGNILTGTELIRRKDGGEAFAVTTPLIKKADGTKFGKTESGNIWLDPQKTSPYKFYQFWLNTSDEDVKNYIKVFTLKSKDEIEELEASHSNAPHLRILQKALACDITERVHGKTHLKNAINASEILFKKGDEAINALKELPENLFNEIFEGVPKATLSKTAIENGLNIVDALSTATSFLSSKGEARRSLNENAISVNKRKVSEDKVLTSEDLLQGKYIVIQKGKKNYYLIEVQ